jgi:hypothetical protein
MSGIVGVGSPEPDGAIGRRDLARADVPEPGRSFIDRRRTADRVFRGALLFNVALTVFWLALLVTGRSSRFFQAAAVDGAAIGRVAAGVFFFYVLWGFIWYGIKAALLQYWAGFSREERRQAFSSRMDRPFEVSTFLARHSERRIRIIDMIGRRGRFITLASAGFYYLYARIASEPSSDFATLFLADNLFDALATSWIVLGFFYANNFVAAAMYGPQSRVMDGVLARANCLLIMTLWTAFKFVMVPIGATLATLFAPDQFAVLFALIWGSYIAADALAEVGGALFGKQRIRVRGIGDVNRKSVGGTVTGFLGCLAFCLLIVQVNGLPAPWLALAVVIAVSNTLLELYSPRGTDDFMMATGNALICLAFGVLLN